MPGGEGAAAPVTRRLGGPRPRRDLGRRRRHGPARPDPTRGLGGGLSPPPPNLRRASGPRPFPRSGLPRPLPGGSDRRGPLPQAESPAPSRGRAERRGRAAAATSRAPQETPRPRPALRALTGPPWSPPARPSSTSLGAAGLPRLSGRPPGALGLGRVRGRGRLAPARGARRPSQQTPALTGPGAPGRADRGGERGCRLR